MAKRRIAVSRASRDALTVLGAQIKQARIAKAWTMKDLADRIGVDSRTLSAVEHGSAHVAVGTVFNAAFAVEVNLFGLEGDELALARRRGEDTLALLPKLVRARSSAPGSSADDDAF